MHTNVFKHFFVEKINMSRMWQSWDMVDQVSVFCHKSSILIFNVKRTSLSFYHNINITYVTFSTVVSTAANFY